MSDQVFFNEAEGTVVQLDGRKVTWLMKAASADTQYSSVCTVEYDAGRRAKPAHAHPNGEETVYIASGHGKAKIGEQTSDIHPGMLVFFPQGVQHMLWNTGTEILKGICFYAPNGSAIEYQFDQDFDFPEFLPKSTD